MIDREEGKQDPIKSDAGKKLRIMLEFDGLKKEAFAYDKSVTPSYPRDDKISTTGKDRK